MTALRVAFFTSFYTNTRHPRIELEEQILQENGCQTTVFQDNSNPNLWFLIINILSLKFFKWDKIFRFKKKIKSFDIVIIYDLSLLPLVLFKQKVIYETLDFNIDLVLYAIRRKLGFFKFIEQFVKFITTAIEKKLVANYVTFVIVNGYELKKYFNSEKCFVGLYSSPFENMECRQAPNLPKAFIYLGLFTTDKGALDAVALSAKYKLPLFIFGNITEKEVAEMIIGKENIHFYDRLSKDELKKALSNLQFSHQLIGVSLIHPIHFSYAVQEANKEIDYLSLGIPFVGNKRTKTEEKIKAGCGIMYDDDKGINQLVTDQSFYNQIQKRSLQFYQQYYHSGIFRKQFIELINE
ncbi:MAG: hypothetical protein NT004_04905 [Bacteroidetes bacterium]|nr:hypothetical protein [Bacteroidota bacterium]